MTVRQFSTLTASSFSVVAILNVAVPAIAESLEINTEAQFERRVVVPGKGKEGLCKNWPTNSLKYWYNAIEVEV